MKRNVDLIGVKKLYHLLPCGKESPGNKQPARAAAAIAWAAAAFWLAGVSGVQAGPAGHTPVPAGLAREAGKLQEPAGEAGIVDRYEEYRERFESVMELQDMEENGFAVIEEQIFPVTVREYGEVTFAPALDEETRRLGIFLADEEGNIVFKTDQLAANYVERGQLRQHNQGIEAVSFQDYNGDGLKDIALITSFRKEGCMAGERGCRVADVLFQGAEGFYRDYRISDTLNRFDMNKSIEYVAAYLLEGKSTEFLYTASTLGELLSHGFRVAEGQSYTRTFEKLGKLQVVPGTYSMANCETFLIYLVNGQGDIIWSFQPMGTYDNLYALKGINCRDIDGDGMKDIIVLARYNYVEDDGEPAVEGDYSIYYQRTGGFSADTEFKEQYRCTQEDTVEELVKKARAYWGWQSEE